MTPPPHAPSLLILLASLILPVSACGEIIASGTLTDKSGDSDMDDLISATITIDHASMVTFEVIFRKSTFKPGFSGVQFGLDLDQNVKTGDSGGRFGKIRGLETAVNLPDYDNDFSETVFFEDDGDILRGGHYPFTTLDDGYRLTVPLKALRATKPTMNFTVTSSQALSSKSSTAILDQIPDQDAPVGIVTLTTKVAGESRIWTDAKTGRTLEGVLQSKEPDGSTAKVLRKDSGKIVTLKSESLVEADREFIKNWKAE